MILGSITIFMLFSSDNAETDFHTKVGSFSEENSNEKTAKNDINEIGNKAELESFAKEMESAPEILEAMQPDADFSKIAQIAIDQLINPDANPMHGLRYRGILWQKPDESLKTIFEKYSTLSSSEQEDQKLKILALASDLCPRSTDADCPTFFMNEANNSGNIKIQLMAVKGYFKSPLITSDEKMVLIQNFKLTQQDPAVLREINELEKYITREEVRLEDKIRSGDSEEPSLRHEDHHSPDTHQESGLGEHL